jgi:hypothetical protein
MTDPQGAFFDTTAWFWQTKIVYSESVLPVGFRSAIDLESAVENLPL